MEKIIVEGGRKLKGTVRVNGAKNSAVALLPASILADSTVTIEGLPNISDVHTLEAILQDIGAGIEKPSPHTIKIDPSTIVPIPLPNGKVKKLRASYYFMGAMLGKFKKAAIGLRAAAFLACVRSINISKASKRWGRKSGMKKALSIWRRMN